MIYVTVKQSPIVHQMTLEELLFSPNPKSYVINSNETNTKTYAYDDAVFCASKFAYSANVDALIRVLRAFNKQYESLREKPRWELYRSFSIPKKSGGLRRIDAPNDELMDALRRLKRIFESSFHVLYHTSAFAYIKGRNTIACMQRHQDNQSKWFGKYDLHNFFGSTTMSFVLRMFSMVFPFSEVMRTPDGAKELKTALDLAFLNGGLPQGTPISPLITNIMMIPIDFELANGFRDLNGQRFVYTRYADDFQISSRYEFNFRDVEGYIAQTLSKFEAPFQINAEKTRYGSSSGSNWNLGLMLNKENEITVGHKKKRRLQAMLSSYIMDRRNGIFWELIDLQTMDGFLNYCRSVEKETIDRILEHINEKFGVDVVKLIRSDLSIA